jgi:hypothetical protein
MVEICFLAAIKIHPLTALYDMLNNPFNSIDTKMELSNIFCIMQQYKNSYKQCIYRWRRKRFTRYENDTDLRSNSLSSYNPAQLISIVENNTIYDFCLPDLIKIINNALLYREDLFSSPIFPKNPYTNLPFGLHNMYNIYFHILSTSQIMPNLLYLFFLSNFNIDTFFTNNEPFLRDKNILSYYKELTEDEKYNNILTMLNIYAKYVDNIIIHAHYPKHKIVDKLGFLLPDYLTCKYSYYATKKHQSRMHIKQSLTNLNNTSPKFGRIAYNNISTSNQFTPVAS